MKTNKILINVLNEILSIKTNIKELNIEEKLNLNNFSELVKYASHYKIDDYKDEIVKSFKKVLGDGVFRDFIFSLSNKMGIDNSLLILKESWTSLVPELNDKKLTEFINIFDLKENNNKLAIDLEETFLNQEKTFTNWIFDSFDDSFDFTVEDNSISEIDKYLESLKEKSITDNEKSEEQTQEWAVESKEDLDHLWRTIESLKLDLKRLETRKETMKIDYLLTGDEKDLFTEKDQSNIDSLREKLDKMISFFEVALHNYKNKGFTKEQAVAAPVETQEVTKSNPKSEQRNKEEIKSKKEISSLKEKIESLKEEIEKTMSLLTDKDVQLEDLRIKISSSEEKHKNKLLDLEKEYKKELKELEKQLSNSNKQIEILEKQINSNSDKDYDKVKNNFYEKELELIREWKQKFAEQKSSFSKKENTLREQIKRLEDINNELKSFEINDFSNEKLLKEEKEVLILENDKLKNEIDKIVKSSFDDSKKLNEEIESWKEKVNNLQKDNKSLNLNISKMKDNDKSEALLNKNKELKSENKELKDISKKDQKDVAAKTKKVSELTKNLDEINAENAKLKDELKDNLNKYNKLNSLYETSKTNDEASKNNINLVKKRETELLNEISESKKEINSLEKSNDKSLKEIKKLKDKLSEIKNEKLKSGKDLKELSKENANLLKKLEKLNQRNEDNALNSKLLKKIIIEAFSKNEIKKPTNDDFIKTIEEVTEEITKEFNLTKEQTVELESFKTKINLSDILSGIDNELDTSSKETISKNTVSKLKDYMRRNAIEILRGDKKADLVEKIYSNK